MPSANSNVTTIRLASDVATWRELDQHLNDCVKNILENCDDEGTRDFMFLIDVLTNSDIHDGDRWCAVNTVQRLAFLRSGRCQVSLEEYLNEINPGRVQKRSRKQVSA